MQSRSLIPLILVTIIILTVLYIFFPVGYLTGLLPASANLEKNLEKIKLPEGFKIEIYARDVKNARSICLGPEGMHFGFPYCHGKDIKDPVYDDRPLLGIHPSGTRSGSSRSGPGDAFLYRRHVS